MVTKKKVRKSIPKSATKPVIKKKVVRKSKKRTIKGRWDLMQAITGKSKYERAREKQIKQAKRRLRSLYFSPKQKLNILEGIKDSERMHKEYTAREKAERAGTQRKEQDW